MLHCWPKDATEAHSQETLQFPVLMQQQPDSPGDAFWGLLSLPWSTAKTAATHVLGSTPEMAHRLYEKVGLNSEMCCKTFFYIDRKSVKHAAYARFLIPTGQHRCPLRQRINDF